MDPVYLSVLVIGGFFTLLTSIWSSVLIYKHIRNYTVPEHQKHIVRILLMPLIYAVDSWLSLYFKHNSWAIFIDIGRDCYEAYVIYSFFKLLVAYLGGKEAVCSLAGKKPSVDFLPLYSTHDGSKFYRRCLQGVIQYVLMRPTLAVIAAILNSFGKYADGVYDWDKGYVYILILLNIIQTIALYCLGMFYQRFENELKPHSPVLKFMVIKGVVFFTFWQSVAIVICGWIGIIPSTKNYSSSTIAFFINDTLICIEMFIAAVAHHKAFSYRQYQVTTRELDLMSSKGISHAEVSSKKGIPSEPSALKVLGQIGNQGDVVRDAVASIVNDDVSFVEYKKFRNFEDEETQKAKQFSIIKRAIPTTVRSPLIHETDKGGFEIEDDEYPNYGGSDEKDDYKSGVEARTRATEFVRTSPKKAVTNLERPAKFGDAILTKPEDSEVQDARYEIELA